MNVKLLRSYLPDITFGNVFVDDKQFCYSLEHPLIDNISNISCIPEGIYKCEVVNSPTKGKVYEIKGVPNRTHVLIHVGNTKKDTLGCVLLGMNIDTANKSLLKSRDAVDHFMETLLFLPFELEIARL